jgi:hypothetical protein
MTDTSQFINLARKHWKYLLQGGTWIMVLLGSFILEPPHWIPQEQKVWFHLSHFTVSALIGLMFIPMTRWSLRRHTWWWWLVAVLFLVSGILFLFNYQDLRVDWTRSYDKKRVVIGSTYTDDAIGHRERVFTAQSRYPSDEELIMDYAGDINSIWSPDETRRRNLVLAGFYLATISLFALGIMALVQALACNTQNRAPRRVAASVGEEH